MSGVIYILTNPSFEQYVKIGYADDVDKRLQQLNRSECIPYAFRKYATYEVEARLSDLKLHAMIDRLNPNLRTIDNIDGKQRVREFYAMSPETAYSILETIAELSGRTDKLHLYDLTETEQQQQELAQEIEESHVERMSPFAFSKCNIPIGSTITYINRGNANSGVECTVIDDKTVEYNGRKLSLSALATELTGSKWGVAGPRYFKYNGEWLNDLRAKVDGRKTSPRVEDIWIIPCNPNMYDIIGAFSEFDVIEWNQATNTSVGDTIFIYVGASYKSIMFKCEVIAANLFGNRCDSDYKYYKQMEKQTDGRYMKLKLIHTYQPGELPLNELKAHGLTNVQGRSKITQQLLNYINKK